MKTISLDPRVTRMGIDDEENMPDAVLSNQELWETFEVFHQKKRGAQHVHVGIVHAPNLEMALMFGKEQYARRGQTTNIWVVKTRDIAASDYSDSDIFESTVEKKYREAGGYKVGDRISAFKNRVKEEQNG